MPSNYRYVGRHPETLANGRPLAPNDTVSLSAEDQKHPHNQRLIEENHLLELKPETKKDGDK